MTKFVNCVFRGVSRTAATSKLEHFVIIVNGLKPLTIITKRSILDIAAVLDPPLVLLQIVVLKITLHKKEFPADLVTFTEEILNEKLHFLRSVYHDAIPSKEDNRRTDWYWECIVYQRYIKLKFSIPLLSALVGDALHISIVKIFFLLNQFVGRTHYYFSIFPNIFISWTTKYKVLLMA